MVVFWLNHQEAFQDTLLLPRARGINKGRHNGYAAVYSYIGNVLNAMPVQPILN